MSSSNIIKPGEDLIKIKSFIKNIEIYSIIPTGAQKNFINKEFSMKLKIKFEESPLNILLANGTVKKVKYCCLLDIYIPKLEKTFWTKFYILPGMKEKVHLGINFLRQNDLCLDIRNNTITMDIVLPSTKEQHQI